MSRSSRLNPDDRRAQTAHEHDHLGSAQLAPQNRLFVFVHPMKLEHVLRGIHSDACDLFHDNISCWLTIPSCHGLGAGPSTPSVGING